MGASQALEVTTVNRTRVCSTAAWLKSEMIARVAVEAHDHCAHAREGPCDRAADGARAACHDGDLPRENSIQNEPCVGAAL